MQARLKKLVSRFIVIIAISWCCAEKTFAQTLNIPYPIVFIHGLNDCDTTWGKQDGLLDNIVDYMAIAQLTPGGNINIALSCQRSATTLSVSKTQDVKLLNQPGFGDYYTINFDVHANGFMPVTHDHGTEPEVTDSFGITNTDAVSQFGVSYPDEFVANDIIRIGNEFMQVTNVDSVNGILTVNRGVCNSKKTIHLATPFGQPMIYNISNESNQASIAKQGWGLKQAIDAILLTTKAKKVILVGHSMGGLAAREYIRYYGAGKVAKIVTIGTPHGGADITNLPNSVLSTLGVDGKSDAVRDLRTSINDDLFGDGQPGVYLFGGSENEISQSGYDDNDVNSNGVSGDNIIGLNSTYSTLNNIARTWIVSNLNVLNIPSGTDGVVGDVNQYIPGSEADTLMTDRVHTAEPHDYYTLLRGLDEPSDPALAYEIQPNTSIKGFITFNQGNSLIEENPQDIDLFKIVITAQSVLTINVSGDKFCGVSQFNLLDANQNVLKTALGTSQTVVDTLQANTYYIQIYGTATHAPNPTYQYPYTLTTATASVPTQALTTSPSSSLNYYDVVLNQSRTKTISITNNGSSALSITNLSLTDANADQFAIAGTTAFEIDPGKSQSVNIKFHPTSTGLKTASFKITSDNPGTPVKTIALTGNGTDRATKTLTVSDDPSYNFDNLTVSTSRTHAITLQNVGSDNLTISDLAVFGSDSTSFAVSNPPATPFVLTSGGTKQVTVSFHPITVGAKTSNLVITSDADNYGPVYKLTLYGNGTNSIYSGVTNKITRYEYWFDNNNDSKISSSVSPSPLAYTRANFSTTGLKSGEHTINFRYQDQNGQWSVVNSQVFIKPKNITIYEYWFDNNYSEKIDLAVTPAQIDSLNTNISTASLATGQHVLNSRFKDDDGQWSAVSSKVFYKPRNIITYEYWFDSNYTGKADLAVTPAQIDSLNTNISTASLATGQHTLNSRFKDDDGQWSAVSSQIFYKTRNMVSYEYWFDSNYAAKVDVGVTPGQTASINTNINAASLPSGEHTFNFRSQDDAGQWSAITSQPFYKPRNLVSYEYWFDSNYAAKVTVPLSPSPNASVNSNVPTASLTAGARRYNVRFKDDHGQWSSVVTDTVTVLSKVATLAGLKLSSGTLTPVFAGSTTSYTASVVNSVNTIMVTPTASNVNANITVNGTAVTSGTSSGAITLNVGSNTITTKVTAQDGTTTKTYKVTVARAPSSNATLSKLGPGIGGITPAFSSGTTSYTISTGNANASMTLTPVSSDANATIKVDGSTVASGTITAPIALTEGGQTVISTVVTAQDGTTTKTYTLTVTRAVSGNATLSNLMPNNGTLSPVFASGTTGYAASVANAVSTITITPTATDANATIKVNGVSVTSGTVTAPIALAEGAQTVITTVVTAQNGTTTKTYALTVTRAPSTNAALSKLGPSIGGLTPAFTSNTTSYTISTGNATVSMKLTPVSSDANATIKVNGTTVTSGTLSGPIALAPGPNTITTAVTAQDGTTTKTYTLTVTRAASGADSYNAGISVTIPIAIGTAETPTLADDGIQVHQGVSPNGDGINDFLQIDNISQYPDNKLSIMNRNGQLIFEAKGYDNSTKVFDGHSNQNGQMQLPGTYFYQLDYTVSGVAKHKTGFLVLKY